MRKMLQNSAEYKKMQSLHSTTHHYEQFTIFKSLRKVIWYDVSGLLNAAINCIIYDENIWNERNRT